MGIYDANWMSYALYVTGTVESSLDYGCIEKGAYVGIGIAQWSNNRSWELLNLLATDYPSSESYFPLLWDKIKPGSNQWSSRSFTQGEANEISRALVTEEGKKTQLKLWGRDCSEQYIPLLQDAGFSDPKVAIFALTCYHQSPKRYYEILNNCGSKCSLETWYKSTLNNQVLGKYKNRQNTVYSLLNTWDGNSAWDGAGGQIPDTNIGGDENQFSLNLGSIFGVDLKITGLIVRGDQLYLNIGTNNIKQISFKKASNSIWIPSNIQQEFNETINPNPNYPNTGSGTTQQRTELVNLIKSFLGKCEYSQAQSVRMRPDLGYCDCSGLCHYCYENVCGIEIGTWTVAQAENGERIQEGSGTGLDLNNILPGDLVLFSWQGIRVQHVEMYIGDNKLCGHGGDPYMGPTIKENAQAYCGSAAWWVVQRYI